MAEKRHHVDVCWRHAYVTQQATHLMLVPGLATAALPASDSGPQSSARQEAVPFRRKKINEQPSKTKLDATLTAVPLEFSIDLPYRSPTAGQTNGLEASFVGSRQATARPRHRLRRHRVLDAKSRRVHPHRQWIPPRSWPLYSPTGQSSSAVDASNVALL